MKNKRVLIATGGTGGHIYPGITLADALIEHDNDVIFIGNEGNMEATLVPASGYRFYAIKNKGLTGNAFLKIWRLLSQVKPTFISVKLLKKIKPDRVIVFGGYVSIPVGFAAWLCGIPLILHEQNAIAGLANRVLAPFASAIAVSYRDTMTQFPKKKTYFTGNPRGSLFVKKHEKKRFIDDLGLDHDMSTILIVMGSLGSETINHQLRFFIPLLKESNYQVIIATGVKHFDDFKKGIDQHVNCAIVDRIDQLTALSYVDVIVCRAGATTVSEVIASLTPAIFVPSPYVVKNHQQKNIDPLLQAEAALLLSEDDFDATSLHQMIRKLLSDPQKIENIKNNLQAFQTPQAIDDMMALIDKAGKDHG